jgi:putative ABC transport system permease protein
MIKSYLITAYRNILRNKFYSILNIIGPATGIACAILIMLYVKEELTFDRHSPDYQRIYRLESDFNISGKTTVAGLVPMPMAPTLKDEYPEIEEFVRYAGFGLNDILFEYKDLKFFEDNIYFTDSTVFKIFNYKFILGSPDGALNEPNTIVITQNFDYHMDFGLPPFVAASVVPFIASLPVTLIIALITTSLVSFKAARANPVDTVTREL